MLGTAPGCLHCNGLINLAKLAEEALPRPSSATTSATSTTLA